jgi:hypothetical protein
MVFSINADPHSDKSFAAFQQLAVYKNGTGVVDPFATAVPTAASAATPTAHLDANFGSKSALGDDGDDSDNSESALVRKLAKTWAPILGGLLVASLVMLLVLIALAATILRRVNHSSASYQQVPLNMPRSTMADVGKYGYEEPKFTHYEGKA